MYNKFMNSAVDMAFYGMRSGFGGPFGACITKVSEDGSEDVICVVHNSVLVNNDPTAHAEICAIRKAGEILKTWDLTNCKLYTTCYPCPMCLAATMWSNIRTVVYGCDSADADWAGFRDADFYKLFPDSEINGDTGVIKLVQQDRDICFPLFEEYVHNKGVIY